MYWWSLVCWSRHYQKLNGENTQGWFWMLAVVLLALEDFCWTKMLLLCHLHQRMSMMLKYSLHLSVEFLLHSRSLEPKSCHFQIMLMIWFTVHDAGFTGMPMVVHLTSFLYIQPHGIIQHWLICYNVDINWTVGGKPLIELNRILQPGGFFIWSATPVYRNGERDQKVWKGFDFCILIYLTNLRNIFTTISFSTVIFCYKMLAFSASYFIDFHLPTSK